jgi:acetyl esterase/lipase
VKRKLVLGLLISGLVTACALTTPIPISTPTLAPTPTFAFEKFGSSEVDITYCTPNNMPQKLDVYYPSSGGPWRVVLYVHGGAWNSGDKAEDLFLRGLTTQGFCWFPSIIVWLQVAINSR